MLASESISIGYQHLSSANSGLDMDHISIYAYKVWSIK